MRIHKFVDVLYLTLAPIVRLLKRTLFFHASWNLGCQFNYRLHLQIRLFHIYPPCNKLLFSGNPGILGEN
jgi:hypothetical protein